MESRRCSDLKFESNSRIHHYWPAHTIFVLYWWDSSIIPKLHVQRESWPLLDGFTMNVKVSYDMMWIFHRVSGLSILGFRSSWVRFAYSACKKLMSFKSVQMCHLVDDSLEGLCHSGHCDHQDWFMGQYKCRMPVRWSCLDLQYTAEH
jgi:hypothetical protein